MATNAITGLTDEEEAQRRAIAHNRGQSLFNSAVGLAKDFLDPTDPLNYLGAFGKTGRRLFALTAAGKPQDASAMIVGVDDVARMGKATDLYKTGKTAEQILKETGLVRVPTKTGFTWGEQISDAGARVNPDVLAQLKTGTRKNIEYGQQQPVPNITLDALLEHPELFKRYPELGKISVEEVNGFQAFGGVQGWFDEAANLMGVKKLNQFMTKPEEVQKQLKDLTSTLLHEAQHAIQGVEKWPRGGNTAEFTTAGVRSAEKAVQKASTSLSKAADALFLQNGVKGLYGNNLLLDDVVKYMNQGEDVLKYSTKEYAAQVKAASNIPDLDKIIKAKSRIDKTQKIVQAKQEAAFKKYQSLGGEAQSRATQAMFEKGADYSTQPVQQFYDIADNELLFKDPFK